MITRTRLCYINFWNSLAKDFFLSLAEFEEEICQVVSFLWRDPMQKLKEASG